MADIPNTQPDSRETTILDAPDKMVKVRDLFGIDSDMAGRAACSRHFATKLIIARNIVDSENASQ